MNPIASDVIYQLFNAILIHINYLELTRKCNKTALSKRTCGWKIPAPGKEISTDFLLLRRTRFPCSYLKARLISITIEQLIYITIAPVYISKGGQRVCHKLVIRVQEREPKKKSNQLPTSDQRSKDARK